ncbi:MAG: hypothetical protein AAF957_25300 [Planctomycetota bacterium]
MTRNARTQQENERRLYEGTMSRQVAGVVLAPDLGVYVQRLRNDRSNGLVANDAGESPMLSTDRLAVSHDWTGAVLSATGRDHGLDVSNETTGASFRLPFDADLQVASGGSAILAVRFTREGSVQSCEFGVVRVSLFDGSGDQIGEEQSFGDFESARLSPRGDAFVVETTATTVLFRALEDGALEPVDLGPASQAWFSDTGVDLLVRSGSLLSVVNVDGGVPALVSIKSSIGRSTIYDHATRSDGAEATVQRDRLAVSGMQGVAGTPWATRSPDGFEFRSVSFGDEGDVFAGVVRKSGSPYLGPGRAPEDGSNAELRVVRYASALSAREPAESIRVAAVPWWNADAPVVRYDPPSSEGARPAIVVWAWPSAWRIDV